MLSVQSETRANKSRREGALDWLPEVGDAVELIALGRSGEAICARTMAQRNHVLVRGVTRIGSPVEGERFTLQVVRRARERRFWLLEGQVVSPHLEPKELPIEPLALLPRAVVGDREEGGERQYELERLRPIAPGLANPGGAAIEEIRAFKESGDLEIAELLAGELLARDLRCIEAHALLGDLFREGPLEHRWTERALRHYRVGAAIGDLSVGSDLDGSLPWRWPGNRPYLHCLYWQARCLERVGDAGSAWKVFSRLLELAPEDPLQVREILKSLSN